MRKPRATAAKLDKSDDFDQSIIEDVPGYASIFEKLGNPIAARACKSLNSSNPPYMMMSREDRINVARALDALSEVLDDCDEQYSLSRFADRVFGYSSSEEG